MSNGKSNSPQGNSKDPSNKLTDQQLGEIRTYLPFKFFTKLAETHGSIDRKLFSAAFYQRTANPEINKVLWGAVNKILQKYQRLDLIEAIEQRLFYCTLLLDV